MSSLSDLLRQVEESPGDARLVQKVGELFRRRGDDRSAVRYFVRACEIYESDGLFLMAIAVYKQVLLVDPEFIAALPRVAELHVMVQLLPEAAAYFRSARHAFAKRGRREEAAAMTARLAELGLPDDAPPTAMA